MPDMDEGAWRRAMSAAASTYKSPAFQIALGLVIAIVGAFAVLIGDGSPKDQIASAILIVASATALVLLLVFATQLALAPVQQRNELRRAWPNELMREPVNIELSLRDFARRGDDMEKKINNRGGYSDDGDRKAAENWTQEVVGFLREYLPSEGPAFVDASKSALDIQAQIRARADELEQIIKRLPS